jgi:hypothetical protein
MNMMNADLKLFMIVVCKLFMIVVCKLFMIVVCKLFMIMVCNEVCLCAKHNVINFALSNLR